MKTHRTFRQLGILFAFIAIAALTASSVAAKGKKPVVAIIKAEWCSACQKLDPTMMELMQQYGDKLDFVVLDVTNEEKLDEAAKTAKKYGLSKFLRDNQKKTSTVAVFVGNKVLFQTSLASAPFKDLVKLLGPIQCWVSHGLLRLGCGFSEWDINI